MKKLYISLIALIFATPTCATGINADAPSADCDNGTLGTYTGPAALSANWTANTINLDFYDGETKLSSGTCTYDGGIELPEDPTKTGYEFDGWKVRRAAAHQQTSFDLSTLDASIPGTSYSYINFNGTASTANSDGTRKVPSAHSITENGEWATEFDYGTVKGIARCSLVPGSSLGQNGNPTDDLNTDGAKYCWCQVTGFDDDKDGTYQSVVSSLWAFGSSILSAANCVSNCAKGCGSAFQSNGALYADFRRTAFGVTQ
jgi:uncharacterized repeat protein (TIGR02543 family)